MLSSSGACWMGTVPKRRLTWRTTRMRERWETFYKNISQGSIIAVCVKKRRAQICDQIQRLIKFLQDYAGRRVRQTRTPNISAERKFTNLIKLKQYRVKRTVSPSTPTCWRQASSFCSRRNTISHRETKTQQTKERRKTREMCSLCWSVLCQVMWHSSSCS